jgi:hypothetical protein
MKKEEFPGASNYICTAKQLSKKYGILASPNPKPGRRIHPEVAYTVEKFYCNDNVSIVMRGKRDYMAVKTGCTKENKQKRPVLSSLSEVFAEFKESHPDLKVGFSKFTSLQPKNCALAGASGTHSGCLCTAHQNVKLMLEGCKLAKLMTDQNNQLSLYHHCLAMMMYSPQQCCFFKSIQNVLDQINCKIYLKIY